MLPEWVLFPALPRAGSMAKLTSYSLTGKPIMSMCIREWRGLVRACKLQRRWSIPSGRGGASSNPRSRSAFRGSRSALFESRPVRGFTLLEILVVVAILALLVAVLLPSLNRIRQQSKRAACMSNLRQIGTAVHSYRQQNRERFPIACAIPPPVGEAGIAAPPLYTALKTEIPARSRVYACPGDQGYVHARAGISYLYVTNLSGLRPEETPFHRFLKATLHDIPVAFDMDGFVDENGGVAVPFFHVRRNLLFADNHVGEYHTRATDVPPQSNPAEAPQP